MGFFYEKTNIFLFITFVIAVLGSFVTAFHQKISIINEVKGIIEPLDLLSMGLNDASMWSIKICLGLAIIVFFIKLFMLIKRKEKIFPITTGIFRVQLITSLFMAYYFVFKISKLTTNNLLKISVFMGGFLSVLIMLISLKGIIDGILIFSRKKK